MKEDDRIFWPPDEDVAMSVLGVSEVKNGLIPVKIDEGFEINIASLAGIFILKVVAWVDRHINGNKDADDIGFILSNYLFTYEDMAIDRYEEIYEPDNFSIITGGARLLGDAVSEILEANNKTKASITKILKDEYNKADESQLINQILETNRIMEYEDLMEGLSIIINKLDK